jgi:hypothetical protein
MLVTTNSKPDIPAIAEKKSLRVMLNLLRSHFGENSRYLMNAV